MILRFLLLSGLALFLAQFSHARIFTSADGRQLEARLLYFTDQEAFLQRQADGRNFQVPLNQLSPEDQQFAQAWLARRQGADHPLGWKRLRLRTPGVRTNVEVPGFYWNVQDLAWDDRLVDVPVGAFIKVSFTLHHPTWRSPEFLLRYHGEEEWILEFDAPWLIQKTEGEDGPGKRVGVTLYNDEWDEFYDLMRKEMESGMALHVPTNYVDVVPRFNRAPISMVIPGVLRNFDELKDLPGGLQALSVKTDHPRIKGLEALGGLQVLELTNESEGKMPLQSLGELRRLRALQLDGPVVAADLSSLGRLTDLKHLHLGNDVRFEENEAGFLNNLRGLRSFRCTSNNNSPPDR